MVTVVTEYYEIILRHRVQDGSRHDPDLEQPIIVKSFISPLMQRSIDINMVCEDIIDEMCHKIKECWMQTKREGGQHDHSEGI